MSHRYTHLELGGGGGGGGGGRRPGQSSKLCYDALNDSLFTCTADINMHTTASFIGAYQAPPTSSSHKPSHKPLPQAPPT